MGETKEYLYLIRPTRADMLETGPTPAEENILAEHFVYLKDLVDKDVVVLAGRTLTTDEHSFGIVVFRANTLNQAQAIMGSDPAVDRGVMRAELYPYRIALLGSNRLSGGEGP